MTMQKAMMPGAINISSVFTVEVTVAKKGDENTVIHPSKTMLITATERAVVGDNQNIRDGGLSSPIDLSCIASCVRLQRRPPHTLAKMTNKNPDRTNAVSDATINRIPAKMIRITVTRRTENASSRKRNANNRTNISEEDLHMAVKVKCQPRIARGEIINENTHYRRIV